jgi:hypothetical protein
MDDLPDDGLDDLVDNEDDSAYYRALIALIQLHRYISVGEDECDNAESCRSEIENAMHFVTSDQKKMVQQLSADLWDVRECVSKSNPLSYRECLRLGGEGEYTEALNLLRGCCDFPSNAIRGLIWTKHG